MLTADDVLSAVRVHADRLHDVVRRLGCPPLAAAHVVETASMELVEAVARGRFDVDEPVGWLFARARALGQAAAGGDDTLPVGGGVLGGDATQVRLAEALEARPERERAALLLRDSYDLPMTAVATALGLDVAAATEAVGQARLGLLPGLTGTPAPRIPDHVPMASLTRLAEGGQQAGREATTRRHTESCDRCAAVVDGQERARRMLTALTVVALPDEEREQLLTRVETRARAALPAAALVVDEWEDEPHRRYSLSLMALGLVAAVGAGIGIGVLTSRGGGGTHVADQQPVPFVSAAPVLTVQPAQLGTPPPTGTPTPRVFYITPSPTPQPTLTATPTPTATATVVAQLQLDPPAGAGGTQITVTGSGWTPVTQVTVQYLNTNGTPGSTVQVVTDANGTFVTTLTASNTSISNPPGPHTVTATNGTEQAQASFTATS